jgi:hypothetical protein
VPYLSYLLSKAARIAAIQNKVPISPTGADTHHTKKLMLAKTKKGMTQIPKTARANSLSLLLTTLLL